jgi:hypothetical protein
MTIPNITMKQFEAMFHIPDYGYFEYLNAQIDNMNKADKELLAEQQESEYTPAAQARELGSGNAEWYSSAEKQWITCNNYCHYSPDFKYRAIKQAQPEPAYTQFTPYDTAEKMRYIQSSIRQPEPIDPHAALRAEYAKQVKEGTTGFYLWEVDWEEKPTGFTSCYQAPEFNLMRRYRCTDISCMVSKDGEPAVRMLRTEAQELQRQTKDTHDWFDTVSNNFDKIGATGDVFLFDTKGTYTYRTKALKQPVWTGSREDVIALLKEYGLSVIAPRYL